MFPGLAVAYRCRATLSPLLSHAANIVCVESKTLIPAGFITSAADPVLDLKVKAWSEARQKALSKHMNDYLVMLAHQHRLQNTMVMRMISRAGWADYYQECLDAVAARHCG